MPSLQEFTPTDELIELVRDVAKTDMETAKEHGCATVCRSAVGNVDLIFDNDRILHKWEVKRWGAERPMFAGTEEQCLDFITMTVYDAIM